MSHDRLSAFRWGFKYYRKWVILMINETGFMPVFFMSWLIAIKL